jgi:hypothetical protein
LLLFAVLEQTVCFVLITLKVLVSTVAVSGGAHFAILASSERVHVSISSHCQLVCSSDGSSPPKQLERESKEQGQSAPSVAGNLPKLGKFHQSLSWNLSKIFNEDPMVRRNLKNGARLLSAMASSSAEALIQVLLLRDYVSASTLIPVIRALVPRLDAAIAPALTAVGIKPIIEHPSLTPQILDVLLHQVRIFEKRQSMLPEVLRLLKSCSSDVLQGRTARTKTFEALLRLFSSISHAFGSSTLSAFDMMSRFVVPLLSKTRSDAGSIINQIIVPRCFMNSRNVTAFMRLLKSFVQVGCRAHISRQIH